jgi:hypothetical protein
VCDSRKPIEIVPRIGVLAPAHQPLTVLMPAAVRNIFKQSIIIVDLILLSI